MKDDDFSGKVIQPDRLPAGREGFQFQMRKTLSHNRVMGPLRNFLLKPIAVNNNPNSQHRGGPSYNG